jgi:8-oxo-dGTP diphosphatase
MYNTEYIPPIVTVDAVIFQLVDNLLHVGLTQRGKDPFINAWALPGGYSAAGETTREALDRIIKRKAGIDLLSQVNYIEQLYTFDTVARDPRGHAVSVTYLACGIGIKPKSSDEKTEFFPVNSLPELAFDHAEIISYAHERLISKLSYTNIVYSLLPKKFTMTELQNAYEAVFGYKLDKRNFRKKFNQLNLIKETNELKRDGAHRPAMLFVFNKQSLQTLVRNFD